MSGQIDSSWWIHSAIVLLQTALHNWCDIFLWYVLSRLWGGAYKRTLTADWKVDHHKIIHATAFVTPSFQPVLHDWCNKGCGMCYPVWGGAYKRTVTDDWKVDHHRIIYATAFVTPVVEHWLEIEIDVLRASLNNSMLLLTTLCTLIMVYSLSDGSSDQSLMVDH